jgi:hypothetical protein
MERPLRTPIFKLVSARFVPARFLLTLASHQSPLALPPVTVKQAQLTIMVEAARTRQLLELGNNKSVSLVETFILKEKM